ncbi:tetratricopeptide repeat protein [Catellatospora sp. KI3]|uniref:ATP-binding protein n=1 Tax=Catellatospora sp. KI3 TaxID=3041620 RepID=UPI0024829FB9|nr:tetratricopeptide repeat protein [Catellatospora sp. KI3]MDI1461182.1 tetratricopeptide repeat protein [Catellatospora sp. KI3]
MFGSTLRALRTQALLTQEELAASSGLSVRQIRELEAGRVAAPRPSSVRALADALALSPEDRERFQQSALPAEPEPQQSGDRADDAERVEPPPSDAPDLLTPAQLPADVTGFTGRDGELAALDQAPPGLVVISGVAGVGKTALAVHWAHRVAAGYADGQLYLNLRGFDDSDEAVDPVAAVRGFLDALGVAPDRVPTDPQAQVALYRSLTADRRLLVVLDNARDADQVRPLVPSGAATRTVVTSRRRLATLIAHTGALAVPLDVPPVAEAVELLARRMGTEPGDRDAVTAIAAACGRLPLALALAGARARLTGFSPVTLALELRRTRGQLEVLADGDGQGVRAVFSWSYRALSPAAAALFRLLGLAAGPDIAVAAVAALAGLPVPQVRRTLRELADASLVTEHVPGRYQLHDLLRAYAAELVRAQESDESRRAALTRLLDHYTHAAYQADLVLNPVRPPIPLVLAVRPGAHRAYNSLDAAVRWLQNEHRVLLATLRQAADAGLHMQAWQLTWALDTFLHERRLWREEGAAWAVALRAAAAMTDQPAAAHAHRFLGAVQGRLARFDDAHRHMSQAVALSRAVGDRAGAGEAHYVLSYVYWLQGDLVRALEQAQQALALYTELRDGYWVGKSGLAVGLYLDMAGEHREAVPYHLAAIDALRRCGDRANEAVGWDWLGLVYQHLGDHAQAVRQFERGLRLARELDDQVLQAQLLTHLGDAVEAVGDLETAREHWLTAYRILNAVGHPLTGDLRRKLRATARQVRAEPS